MGKQIRYKKAQQNKNSTDKDGCLNGQRTDLVDSFHLTGTVIGGENGLSRLINSFAKGHHDNGSITDNPVYSNSHISNISQKLQIKDKNCETGRDFYQEAGKAIDGNIS